MFAARQALRTTARVAARPLAAPARRPMSYDAFYKSALKSNMSQVTFVVAGAVIFEVVYGMGTEAMWSRANEGKLADQVDWSKWSADDDDDEDDDDEDED